MALLFQTQITTNEGFVVDNAYGRVAVNNGAKGNTLECDVYVYASEAAFEAGANPFIVPGVRPGVDVAYDYATDEKDILDLAHDALIQSLGAQGINAVKSL